MKRPSVIHVVLIDGTFASLMEGRHSNIGQIYKLLRQLRGVPIRLHYAAGQQWEMWRDLPRLAGGEGVARRIQAAYAWLAGSYRPGDQIYLLGYSRGAFAVRSLAGMISRVGLLHPEAAVERNVRLAWRYYRDPSLPGLDAFRAAGCEKDVEIRLVGVFDTVMALGVRLPLLWMLTEPRFRFHDHQLGREVARGAQALALDETRAAFQPILWRSGPDARVRQMWFRGAHADIGGQLAGFEPARGLANIPLNWMLSQCAEAGLPLPEGWREGLHLDPAAPSVGSWRGWGKAFLARAPRLAGSDPSEAIHPSALPYHCAAILSGPLAVKAGGAKRRHRRRAARVAGGEEAQEIAGIDAEPCEVGAQGESESTRPTNLEAAGGEPRFADENRPGAWDDGGHDPSETTRAREDQWHNAALDQNEELGAPGAADQQSHGRA
ncbi:MAG: DUF2235 domain-containing protein [Paracoccus sp. (in: a-proteobacteria)]|nr:DUF2235 domain-containing protein [Paracoccus sp. (in: a-proteobacteria)]